MLAFDGLPPNYNPTVPHLGINRMCSLFVVAPDGHQGHPHVVSREKARFLRRAKKWCRVFRKHVTCGLVDMLRDTESEHSQDVDIFCDKRFHLRDVKSEHAKMSTIFAKS